MIIFQNFINLLEAFIFPIFLSTYFDLPRKKYFIIISGTLQFIILVIFNYIQLNNFILTFTIIFFNIISLYVNTKILNLENIIITIIYNFILLLSTIIGMIIFEAILNLPFDLNLNDTIQYIVVCIIGKTVLLICTSLLIRFKRFSIYLETEKWRIIIIFELLIVFAIITVSYAISMNMLSLYIFYLILLMLIILNFLFIFVVYRINELNNENLEYVKSYQIQQFNNEKLIIIKNLKNEIDAIDHRLFYIIFQIDNLLNNNQIDKIHTIIDQYKSVVLKQNLIIDTGNDMFDALISLKINDLILNNITIKNCIFISKENFYNNYSFIRFLTVLLDFLSECTDLQLFIEESSNYTIIRIIYDKNDLNITSIEIYLSNELSKFNGRYKVNLNNKEIKIIVDRGN